jgi:hypothetical protein
MKALARLLARGLDEPFGGETRRHRRDRTGLLVWAFLVARRPMARRSKSSSHDRTVPFPLGSWPPRGALHRWGRRIRRGSMPERRRGRRENRSCWGLPPPCTPAAEHPRKWAESGALLWELSPVSSRGQAGAQRGQGGHEWVRMGRVSSTPAALKCSRSSIPSSADVDRVHAPSRARIKTRNPPRVRCDARSFRGFLQCPHGGVGLRTSVLLLTTYVRLMGC